MKIPNVSKYLLLVPAASLCFAQDPIKPGTPAPKPPAAAASVSPDTVVLTVGNEKITRAQFENLLAALPDQVRASATGPNKRKLAEQLAEVKAMAQEARKRKLDQDPQVQQLVSLQTENALAGALYKELQSNAKPDDAALRAYYDAHKGQYEEVKARHILIRFKGSAVPLREGQKDLTEEEALAKAQDIRKKLQAGADFATLAKAESDDTGSGAQGGSLGSFSKGQMVKEFETAAFLMPVGQISEPVKTQFGYHIIKVEGHSNKAFEEAKPDIAKQIGPDAARSAVDGIRDHASIKLDDAYFGQ